MSVVLQNIAGVNYTLPAYAWGGSHVEPMQMDYERKVTRSPYGEPGLWYVTGDGKLNPAPVTVMALIYSQDRAFIRAKVMEIEAFARTARKITWDGKSQLVLGMGKDGSLAYNGALATKEIIFLPADVPRLPNGIEATW